MTPWLLLTAAGAALLMVPWVAYPWAMTRRAGRGGSPRPAHPAAEPLVSVVLATREPPPAVLDRLEDLLAGQWPVERLELVVAVDGDPAPYRSLAPGQRPLALRVVARGQDTGKAAALNAGVAAATGEILIFTDTAQRFAPDAIPRLVGALEQGPFAAVSGALRIGNEATGGGLLVHYWRLERRLREAEARLHSAIGVSGSIYAMRRAHWTPLPPGLILDDLWVPMRLILDGGRVGFEPDAVAFDTRTTRPAAEYRRKVRTLTGNLQLVAWMPGVLLPWRNPVWIQFWCHKLLRLTTPMALLMVAAGGIGNALTRWGRHGGALLALLTGSLLLAALVPGRPGRTLRAIMSWILAMTFAILSALWNGVRGKWEVWR